MIKSRMFINMETCKETIELEDLGEKSLPNASN